MATLERVDSIAVRWLLKFGDRLVDPADSKPDDLDALEEHPDGALPERQSLRGPYLPTIDSNYFVSRGSPL